MGSYNKIHVVGDCPKCLHSTQMEFQLHSFSSFDGDDDRAFCLRDYKMGEKLRWFPETHKRFNEWHKNLEEGEFCIDGLRAQEHCYGDCKGCASELTATLNVENGVVTAVQDIQIYLPPMPQPKP